MGLPFLFLKLALTGRTEAQRGYLESFFGGINKPIFVFIDEVLDSFFEKVVLAFIQFDG
jgi:hypothetical protein